MAAEHQMLARMPKNIHQIIQIQVDSILFK